ncbi:putative white collar 1 protein [Echria macrotheca]|uniref:White collar 1 protein n=1 Tax=Echria macrotheca TaxID=438768 RepID=A0AAJ0F4L6_9PEZI|nr:putative white collar 1 protein [Echria macrotheca]
MDNYYPSPLSTNDVQRQMGSRRAQQNRNHGRNNVAMINTSSPGDALPTPLSAMSDMGMPDDMVQQDAHEFRRRQSVPQHYPGHLDAEQKMSMVGYSPGNGPYQNFGFGNMVSPTDDMSGGYGDMGNDMVMPDHSGPFAEGNLLAMSEHVDFANLSPEMMGNMMAFSNLNMGSLTANPHALHLFGSPSMQDQYPPSTMGPVSTDFAMDLGVDTGPLNAPSTTGAQSVPKNDDTLMDMEQDYGPPDGSRTPQAQPNLHINPTLGQYTSNLNNTLTQEVSEVSGFQSPVTASSRPLSLIAPAPADVTMTPVTAGPEPDTSKSIYSKSGFDMLRALWYVASRKNPRLNIGAVDMSCAFVVCDVTLNDCPIIYVSDNFQNLTGYNRYEIVGKNCRFLQSPTGEVEAGTKRDFVENHAVYNLKEAIRRGEEIQQSLINYRKGGKPFLNLLTMIPIPWDTDEIRYFIGFQIDLVECPDAISGHEPNGAMTVSYTHSDITRPIWDPPSQSQWDPENGQTLGIDDVSTLLQSFNPKGVTSDWHKQSWDKMLLENADDVIHVLSLKGLFLYVSPSCKKVLGYDASELVGKNLETICHPSDIVPITRDLKDAQPSVPVNIAYRIAKKQNGFMWFEGYGSLFSEQGKGRKCIILVGRKRPTYTLRKLELEMNGGVGDSEIWTKVSTSGMFLHVSSNVRSLLDLQPGDLAGTSMQDLMRKETRADFGRTMEKARKGHIVSCKHEVQNKRGQVLQALTTFYPGDAAEGQKPSFLLGQTKLLKASSRAIAPASNLKTTPTTPAPAVEDPISPSSTIGRTPDLNPTAQFLADRTQEERDELERDLFDELSETRCTSWIFELRQVEKDNRLLAEELATLLSNRKKRKRRKGGNMVRDCANCHTRNTPEWRRGPSGNRDLCNSCGLRWAKTTGRVSPRNSSKGGNGDTQSKKSNSPIHSSPLHREMSSADTPSLEPPTRASTTPTSTTEDFNAPIAVTPPSNGNGVSGKGINNNGAMNPPPSRPLLEGGSGLGGSGMEMTAIQEERETSA